MAKLKHFNFKIVKYLILDAYVNVQLCLTIVSTLHNGYIIRLKDAWRRHFQRFNAKHLLHNSFSLS